MRAYYASKISPNMARTREGYLICYNVPIARTGMQEYLGIELGISGELSNQLVPVYRYSEDVFSPAALASFEGKPVTDNHPPEYVMPDNISRFLKGVATNIRRGQGAENDKVLADLIIYDSILISEIESGKREISCGYDCVYEENEKGQLCQRGIEGNHVAVVGEGRAGSTVAIKDEQPKKQVGRSKKYMAKRKSNSNGVTGALARLFPMFSTDAAPEEITDAVEALVDSIAEANRDEEVNPNPTQTDNEVPEAQDDETKATLKQIADSIQSLNARLDSMEAVKSAQDDPLAQLEDELMGEETMTIPVEEMDEEQIDEDIQQDEDIEVEDEEETMDEGVVAPTSERPENPISNADKRAILKEIRAMRPIIAGMKDQKAKKKMADSCTRLCRQAMGLRQTNKQINSYAAIMNAKQTKARQQDAKNKKYSNDSQLGKDIAAKFNPHYKNKK